MDIFTSLNTIRAILKSEVKMDIKSKSYRLCGYSHLIHIIQKPLSLIIIAVDYIFVFWKYLETNDYYQSNHFISELSKLSVMHVY